MQQIIFLKFRGESDNSTDFCRIFCMTEEGMLSLSYNRSRSRNFMSPSSLTDGPQKSSSIFPVEGSCLRSGLMLNMMHTASSTSFTTPGGFWQRSVKRTKRLVLGHSYCREVDVRVSVFVNRSTGILVNWLRLCHADVFSHISQLSGCLSVCLFVCL